MTLRRRKVHAAVAATLWLYASFVRGIAVDICSTENTGSSSSPNTDNLQSLGHCRDQCNGFAYAITQAKGCWCSDYAPSSSTSTGSCNLPCPGYPYEQCGSSDGDYSYIQIGTPSGTGVPFVGAPSSVDPIYQPSSPAYIPSSTQVVYTPPPDTIYQTVQNTIVSSNLIVQTSIVTQDPITQIQTSIIPVTQHVTISSSSQSQPTVSIPRPSARIITVSGAAQTQFITASAAPTPSLPSGSTADVRETRRQGLSGGAVAGIVIGVVAGLAGLGLLIFFCCFRRGKGQEVSAGGINRNTSVLSKAGLLRHPSTGAGVAMAGGSAGRVDSRPPRLDTDIPGVEVSGPSSAASIAGGGMLERRDSRPLFRDHRLNPNALMQHSDTSRTSVGTLQDDKDYSRPLEVRNPDQRPPRL